MMKRSLVFISTVFLPACFFGAPAEVVYYPPETTTVVIEEPHTHDDVPHSHTTADIVVTETQYTCSPVLEDYYAPFYHTPEFCTDYGAGVGYCCTWQYVDGYSDCSSEWCFWEDMCQWEPVVDECIFEHYDYY